MAVGEADSFLGESVEMGSLDDRAPVATQAPKPKSSERKMMILGGVLAKAPERKAKRSKRILIAGKVGKLKIEPM